MLKEEIIKRLYAVINAVEKSDESKIKLILATSELDEINKKIDALNSKIEKEKEQERLKEVFNYYIECIKINNVNECMEKFGYTDIKKLKRDVMKYNRLYSTDEELFRYQNAKEYIGERAASKKKTIQNYRENCMNYGYVQDLIKLLYVDYSQLFEYYINNNITSPILKQYAKRYIECCQISESEKRVLEKGLDEYEVYYNNYINKKNLSDRNKKSIEFTNQVKSETSKLIKDILESKHSLKVYSDLNRIEYIYITTQLKRLKSKLPEEYEEFMKAVEKNAIEESKQNATLALQMNSQIFSGIEEDGYSREFDIVDYHMATNLGIDAFLKSAKITLKDLSKVLRLKEILSRAIENKRKDLDLETELSTKNTFIVNGEELEIPKEEKFGFVEYLEKNGIPVDFSTYAAMEKRYKTKIINQKNKSI